MNHEKLVLEILASGGPAMIQLDAREANVPLAHKDDPRLVLRIGYNLQPPILDLDINSAGIVGTLAFGGVPHRCIIPWSAVYAVVDVNSNLRHIWPMLVPTEVLLVPDEPPSPTPGERTTPTGNKLKLVN